MTKAVIHFHQHQACRSLFHRAPAAQSDGQPAQLRAVKAPEREVPQLPHRFHFPKKILARFFCDPVHFHTRDFVAVMEGLKPHQGKKTAGFILGEKPPHGT